jgi:hypothetical protein
VLDVLAKFVTAAGFVVACSLVLLCVVVVGVAVLLLLESALRRGSARLHRARVAWFVARTMRKYASVEGLARALADQATAELVTEATLQEIVRGQYMKSRYEALERARRKSATVARGQRGKR